MPPTKKQPTAIKTIELKQELKLPNFNEAIYEILQNLANYKAPTEDAKSLSEIYQDVYDQIKLITTQAGEHKKKNPKTFEYINYITKLEELAIEVRIKLEDLNGEVISTQTDEDIAYVQVFPLILGFKILEGFVAYPDSYNEKKGPKGLSKYGYDLQPVGGDHET